MKEEIEIWKDIKGCEGSYEVSRNTWQAAIRIDGKIKHLGYSKNEQIASDLYQNALKKINKKIQI